MKSSIFCTICIFLVINGCSSHKKMSKSPPFAITSPSCQLFSASGSESRSGFVLSIPITISSNTSIKFNEVYFRGHILLAEMTEIAGKQVITCEYKEEEKTPKTDIIMHGDPKKEVGNQPPNKINMQTKTFPFELEKSEAVLSYTLNPDNTKEGSERYHKISDIEDKVSGM